MAKLPPLSDGAQPPSAIMKNWMAEVGARLVDNGYPVIPILPGSKSPGRFTRGHWTGYPEWTRHAERPTHPFEIGIWRTWPGCGVGVACGPVCGVDIDVMDAGAADEIQARAFAELGETPAIRFGLAPKRLLVYRATTPFRPVKRHPLEALALGSQFVAYAEHPDTRQPYRWPIEELVDLPMSQLPAVDEQRVRRFMDGAYALVPPELRRATLGPDRSADHYYSGGDLRGTLAAVASAMAYIPNDDLHYDDWIRIGLAIKGAVGEAGLPLFEAWSRKARKSGSSGKPDTPAKVWRSLAPKQVGAGTIYYFATQNGWVPEPNLILNGALADAVEAVPVGSVALTTAPPAELEVKQPVTPQMPAAEIPAEIMQPGGLIGDIAAWMVETAIYPQPFLAMAAAICAVATAAGRRFAGPWDTRTNIYAIGIAESGSGKEHQLTCLNNLFFAADLIELFAGEEIASGTAIESTVAARAVQLFQIDEFGHFMKSVLNPRASSSHRREVLVKLTKYTGAATRLVKGTEYANKKERERIDVHEPCVCLYGTTVAEPLWEAFGSGALQDGSVARMLFFKSAQNFPRPQRPAKLSRDVPASLVTGLRRIVAGTAHENEVGFRAAKGQMLDGRNRPSLTRVDYSENGARMADQLAEQQVDLKRHHEMSRFSPIWARWLEHINRLALVRAVSLNPIEPEIDEQDLTWARALVDHCFATLGAEVEAYVADSQHEATLKRLLGIIRRHGSMSGREFARATQWLGRRERAEALSQLEESGLAKVTRLVSTGGRPGLVVEAISHFDERGFVNGQNWQKGEEEQ